jgi:hypothetical protein
MEKDFESLLEALKRFEGVSILNTSTDPAWVHFKSSADTVEAISAYINELADQYQIALLLLANQEDPEDYTYQLVFDGDNRATAVQVFAKKLAALAESGGNMKKAKQKEAGLPDLSLVTIRQMAQELKSRQNLTFALVWIENNERDNIAIEGSGNPTQLVGLLARGMHMAIEWADKNIKFYRPKDEE